MNNTIRNNLIFIFTFVALIVSVFYINKEKDPYNTKNAFFGRDLNFFTLSSDLYYTTINLTKQDKFDYVIIGGSASNMLFLSNRNLNARFAYINLPYVSSSELYEVLSYFLSLHPEVKTVFVALEYNAYIQCFSESVIKTKSKNLFKDIIRLYFSIDVTKKSLTSIFDDFRQQLKKSEELPVQDKEVPEKQIISIYNEMRSYDYSQNTCEYNGISNLKKIYDLINSYNIKGVYFIPPAHANFLSIIYLYKKYEFIEKFKKEIAKITPYYDMSFINYYTTKPLKYFFHDVFHPSYEMLGKRIFDCLFLNKIDKNLAVYITKDNVDNILKNQKFDLENYVNKNRKYLENYKNEVSKLVECSQFDKYLYYDDVKNTEFEKFFLEN